VSPRLCADGDNERCIHRLSGDVRRTWGASWSLHVRLKRIREINLTLISVNTDASSTHDSDTEA
jgi:hypothetical protein